MIFYEGKQAFKYFVGTNLAFLRASTNKIKIKSKKKTQEGISFIYSFKKYLLNMKITGSISYRPSKFCLTVTLYLHIISHNNN